MADTFQKSIQSIFGGHQASLYFGQQDQYQNAIAIDPDAPLTDASTEVEPAGVLRPVAYEKFSSTNVNALPIAIINTPKNALTYTVLSNGRLISYDASLGSETLIGTVTGSVAHGATYYNNYIYIFGTGTSQDDVSRYGPLSGTPALTNGVWKGSTLGTQTALTDTTYPTTRHSTEYLNHWGTVHSDNKLYFLDFVNGQGLVHFIKTTKTTDEGDTNDGSTYNALDLPFGYMPFDIESLGNLVVIAASPVSSSSVSQGSARLFIWDTVSESFVDEIKIPDPICTALRQENGVLYGWSGSASGGSRLFAYIGDSAIKTLAEYEGHPPMQGAIATYRDKIYWGTFTTSPDNSASVLAYGSKTGLIQSGLHNVARSTVTATSSNGLIGALKHSQQGSAFPKLLIGATDGTNYNIDKQSTTYQTSYWRSQVFRMPQSFKITRIRLPLGAAVAANMTLTPTLYFDEESNSSAGTTINNTNYSDSQRVITLRPGNFSNGTSGVNNFYLQLKWTGTALLPVLLPIIIEGEYITDKS